MIRTLLASLILASCLTLSPAVIAETTPAPITQQAQNNRPYLLVFPVLVLGVIGALLVWTRKK
jgi:hypothetical protein